MDITCSAVSGNPLMHCKVCGERMHSLWPHLVTHDMSMATYQKIYGEAIFSSDVLSEVSNPPQPAIIIPAVDFAGQEFEINMSVPQQDCLPLPAFYRIPQYGPLASAVIEAAIALKCSRSLYIHGPPGSGKDALFMAWSALTRTPALKFQILPQTDIRAWFFSRALSSEGSFWEEGLLLKALRDGYRLPDGNRIPYLIVITDWDRATRQQAEWLRLVLDSIEGRVPGPSGVTYPLFPGTLIVATGNTAGGGDPKARMISANPMDASIQERWERSFYFHWLDWQDEQPILRQKHPLLMARCADALVNDQPMVQKVTESIREAIGQDKLYMEFSHRSLCSWLGHAEDILRCLPSGERVPPDLFQRAAQAFLTRIADPYTKQAVINLMDPHIPGGMTPQISEGLS